MADPWIDPELRAALERLPATFRSASLGVADTSGLLAMRETLASPPPADDEVTLDGWFALSRDAYRSPDGQDLPLLVLDPPIVSGLRPCLFYVHGGGYVSGAPHSGLARLLETARSVGAVVVSPTYRLAPEHPHPTPVEDGLAAFLHVIRNAEQMGIDPGRVVAIGASAGGGLVAGMSLLARDRGLPQPLAQLLIAPMLDRLTGSGSGSHQVAAWDAVTNQTAWRALLGGSPDAASLPYATAAHATDLCDLPSTYAEVGSADLFCDETVRFTADLARAGVAVELHVLKGAVHGFDVLAPDARISVQARDSRAVFLRHTLSVHPDRL